MSFSVYDCGDGHFAQILQEFLLDLAAQEREEYYLDQYGKVGSWIRDIGRLTMVGGSGISSSSRDVTGCDILPLIVALQFEAVIVQVRLGIVPVSATIDFVSTSRGISIVALVLRCRYPDLGWIPTHTSCRGQGYLNIEHIRWMNSRNPNHQLIIR